MQTMPLTNPKQSWLTIKTSYNRGIVRIVVAGFYCQSWVFEVRQGQNSYCCNWFLLSTMTVCGLRNSVTTKRTTMYAPVKPQTLMTNNKASYNNTKYTPVKPQTVMVDNKTSYNNTNYAPVKRLTCNWFYCQRWLLEVWQGHSSYCCNWFYCQSWVFEDWQGNGSYCCSWFY
jgi:hypothetical protein